MKLTTLIAGLSLVLFSCQETGNNSDSLRNLTIERKLHALLNRHEYFDLRDAITKYQDSLSPVNYAFFSSFVQNAFNQNERSVKTINDVLQAKTEIADSLRVELLIVLRDNLIKL